MESYEQIVTAAQAAGPQEKRRLFDNLAAHFQPIALIWAKRLLQDQDAAEDAVQDALLIAYQQLGTLREPAAFPGWLKRIVVSQCARVRRHWRPGEILNDEWISSETEDDPAEQAHIRWSESKLRGAVGSLSLPERTVTQMYYLDEYSQQEIATLLQVPLTTVKKRLQYAREHLRERMPIMNRLYMPGDGAQLHVETAYGYEWVLGYAATLNEMESVA
ncbi:MAG TPA: RNA polymerase sigma factor [Aggregatilineales bacterium]|nr:RNA polymerase sigma factor [Aggregatilineales bacterium]